MSTTSTTRRWSGRTVAAAAVAAAGLTLAGAGVYSALTATANNTTAESVTSGTLKLTLGAETGAVALSTAVPAMAPGDVSNRYVVLTNGGTLDGKALGIQVGDGAATVLSTSATKGLSLTVTACSVAWAPTTGVCAGTTTTYLAKTALSSLASRTAFTGPVNPVAGSAVSLQLSLSLDATETTVNGTLPAGTAQGLTSTLTYTFTEDQRVGATTNS